MAKHAEFCRDCSPLIRDENHYAWKGGGANDVTKRQRSANAPMPDGQLCEYCGDRTASDRHHVDGDPGNNTPENLQFLCRRCHMVLDGRLTVLLSHNATRERMQPRPCVECGKLTNRTWYGACHACNERKRRAAKRAATAVSVCDCGGDAYGVGHTMSCSRTRPTREAA